MRGESNFREKYSRIFLAVKSEKDEIGKQLPELVLLTARNFREYFYTKIRFSTPGLSALLPMAGQIQLYIYMYV